MSSPNLNIVTLLGSGLTYTSAYLFGIQEQSLPSGDSVEKLIQVSRGFAGTSAFRHAHACMSMHVCTCSPSSLKSVTTSVLGTLGRAVVSTHTKCSQMLSV